MEAAVRAAIVMLLVGLCGCYTYVPVSAPGLSRGTDVQAHLSTPGSFDIGAVTANDITSIQGEVVTWTEDELVLSAFGLESVSGRSFDVNGRTLTIPGPQIAGIERKRLSRLKTGAIAGIGLLLAIFADAAFGGGGIGGDAPPGGGPVTK